MLGWRLPDTRAGSSALHWQNRERDKGSEAVCQEQRRQTDCFCTSLDCHVWCNCSSTLARIEPEARASAGSPDPGDGAQAWDRPGAPFEEFVGKVISHRLGKYKQPDHPNRISREDFKELYRKSWKAIIEAERKVTVWTHLKLRCF